MVPLYKIEKTSLAKILAIIKKHVKQFYNSDIYIGVSKSYNTANALRAAYAAQAGTHIDQAQFLYRHA